MGAQSKKHKHTSKLTRRNQTTLPVSVRKALGLTGGDDVIEYIIESDKVILTRYTETEHTDEVVQQFLHFLELDMLSKPGRITPLSASWKSELEALVGHIDVDLNAGI